MGRTTGSGRPVAFCLTNYLLTLAPRHQVATGIASISSSTRRNGGCGATHRVRNVSRKASYEIRGR